MLESQSEFNKRITKSQDSIEKLTKAQEQKTAAEYFYIQAQEKKVWEEVREQVVNRTYGNFASGMSEAFMVLNRNYQMKIGTMGETLIDDLTTYIDPVKYNYIFADTSIEIS